MSERCSILRVLHHHIPKRLWLCTCSRFLNNWLVSSMFSCLRQAIVANHPHSSLPSLSSLLLSFYFLSVSHQSFPISLSEASCVVGKDVHVWCHVALAIQTPVQYWLVTDHMTIQKGSSSINSFLSACVLKKSDKKTQTPPVKNRRKFYKSFGDYSRCIELLVINQSVSISPLPLFIIMY